MMITKVSVGQHVGNLLMMITKVNILDVVDCNKLLLFYCIGFWRNGEQAPSLEKAPLSLQI